MKMKIFPDSVINQSYEKIISEHGKKTGLIYQTVIVALAGIFISLFFIHVDVGVTVTGTIQPRGEARLLIAPASGILKMLDARENLVVKRGDTIFIVRDPDTGQGYPVYSPVDGICAKPERLTEGLKVSAGQQLIEILPLGDLRVECNIPSQGMGLLREGLPCRVQIDAYNYNQWGMLEGTLTGISDNPVTTFQGVFYKAYCSLDRDYLELKNGYKGYLKRGMNANCRFIVNQRSVFNLLYDKIEEWINPLNGQPS
jgi:multidrug resistance efflux pump